MSSNSEHHEHHHKETFITKYIFSQDHKMICKQYLITGLFMGIIGIAMSLVFRLQLAWPEEPFWIMELLLGDWAPEGVMDPNVYSLSNNSWYYHGIFCLNRWTKWNL